MLSAFSKPIYSRLQKGIKVLVEIPQSTNSFSQMVEAIEKLFGKSSRVLVEDGEFNDVLDQGELNDVQGEFIDVQGEFNDVQGEGHHYDYSQRMTSNAIHNVNVSTSNSYPQAIYHDERGSGSMHRDDGSFATSPGATKVAASASSSSPYHNPQSQVPIRNNATPSSYNSLSPQNPGQYFRARSGDICQMSVVQVTFMNKQMAHMMQEIDFEFGRVNEEQDTVGYEMYNDDTIQDATKSQSPSADFNRLTIEECPSSSSRSAFIHRSSSTTVEADKSPNVQ